MITPAYIAQIRLAVKFINVGAKTINDFLLKTHKIVFAKFLVQDKRSLDQFFEKTFLLVDISIEVVLGMPFFSLGNTDFDAKDLTWMSYITIKTLPSTSQVELMDKRKFAKVAWDKNSKIFVIHVAALVVTRANAIKVYSSRAPQLALLQWDKALAKIPAKYINHADVFLSNLAMELPENTDINKHAIKLVKSK